MEQTEQGFGLAKWKAPKASNDQSVVVTPCEPIPIRLTGVRIMWEPSSFLADSDRKNIYFELNDAHARAFLEFQESALNEEGWGEVNSCLAKAGLVRCKVNVKTVRVFDKDKCFIETPRLANVVCNALITVIGKWHTPDGSAVGLNLQVTDLQVLRAYEPQCPF